MAYRGPDPKPESLSAIDSVSAGDVKVSASNTSNTASSTATLEAKVAGTSSSDATAKFIVSGTTTWSAGVDNSDSDAFKIAPNADVGTTPSLSITTAGAVTIPGTLGITGDTTASAHVLAPVNTGSIYDEGDPAYSFVGDTDTGMFSEGANQLNFATGGTLAVSISSAQDVTLGAHVLAPVNNGTIYDEGDPVYSFVGDTDTGIYSEGADQLNLVTGGVAAINISSAQAVAVPAGSLTIGTTGTTVGLVLNNNTSSYSPATLNHYENTTFTATFTQTGGFSQAVTVRAVRIGNWVNLNVPSFQATATASASLATGADIPARFRPNIEVRMLTSVSAGGVSDTPGGITISTGGVMTLTRTISGSTFTSGTAIGLGQGGTSVVTFGYYTT